MFGVCLFWDIVQVFNIKSKRDSGSEYLLVQDHENDSHCWPGIGSNNPNEVMKNQSKLFQRNFLQIKELVVFHCIWQTMWRSSPERTLLLSQSHFSALLYSTTGIQLVCLGNHFSIVFRVRSEYTNCHYFVHQVCQMDILLFKIIFFPLSLKTLVPPVSDNTCNTFPYPYIKSFPTQILRKISHFQAPAPRSSDFSSSGMR